MCLELTTLTHLHCTRKAGCLNKHWQVLYVHVVVDRGCVDSNKPSAFPHSMQMDQTVSYTTFPYPALDSQRYLQGTLPYDLISYKRQRPHTM